MVKNQVNTRDKFIAARDVMDNAMIERTDEIDIVLTALIAGEHPLLVGPPGTGKSFLLDSVARWVKAPKFDYLLTKFTDPMELFGPTNITALKAGKCERIVDGMMPTCPFVFLDEIFKASSAILNTLLKLLNERKFKYGQQAFESPLVICVAASNEWPQDQEGGKELGALFDRFLLRKTVREIMSQAGQRKLLEAAMPNFKTSVKPQFEHSITMEEIELANDDAGDLEFTKEAFDALTTILNDLAREGVRPSSRRKFKSVRVAQAYAYLCGADKVEPEHLAILAHTLWDDPTEQPAKVAKVIAKVANPIGMVVADQLMKAESIISGVFDKVSAEAAAFKLEEIEQALEALKQDPRRDKAISYIAKARKANYAQTLGLKKKDYIHAES